MGNFLNDKEKQKSESLFRQMQYMSRNSPVRLSGLVPGMACIQHFVLRLVLYINRIAPWNYSQFLNYATEKKILRRKGGSYQFLNPELQNYFCTLIINHKD